MAHVKTALHLHILMMLKENVKVINAMKDKSFLKREDAKIVRTTHIQMLQQIMINLQPAFQTYAKSTKFCSLMELA